MTGLNIGADVTLFPSPDYQNPPIKVELLVRGYVVGQAMEEPTTQTRVWSYLSLGFKASFTSLQMQVELFPGLLYALAGFRKVNPLQ